MKVKERRLIGLSLSWCIADILKGKVKVTDIVCIISNTAFGDVKQIKELYKDPYWSEFDEEEVMTLLKSLRHIIYQPKRDAGNTFRISKGHWYDTTTGKGQV